MTISMIRRAGALASKNVRKEGAATSKYHRRRHTIHSTHPDTRCEGEITNQESQAVEKSVKSKTSAVLEAVTVAVLSALMRPSSAWVFSDGPRRIFIRSDFVSTLSS